MTKYDFSKVDRSLLEKVAAAIQDCDVPNSQLMEDIRKQAEVWTKAELAGAITIFLDSQLSYKVVTPATPTHINLDPWQGRVIRELLQKWREASE
jgi:hypothetical protein